MPSDSTLTLLIPDLFGFQSTLSQLSQDELSQLPVTRFPILEKWLSRGTLKKSDSKSDILASEFGLMIDSNKDRPHAALSLLAENNKEVHCQDYYWLRADPVNLYADRDTVLLSAHEELALSQEEANKLVDLINNHFKDEPWTLYSQAPHRWYLALEKTTDLLTHSLHDVIGKNIHHYAAKGEDASYWQSILNEIQMLLHSTNVNIERESTNRYSANSVWLWGGGELPAKQDSKNTHDVVIANDVLYAGLGYHCGLDVFSLDDDFIKYIQKANSFVVLDMLSEHINSLDLYRFMQTLADIEENILAACNELLLSKKIKKIVLLFENGTSITITRKQLRHWWKRIKPFVKFNYA